MSSIRLTESQFGELKRILSAGKTYFPDLYPDTSDKAIKEALSDEESVEDSLNWGYSYDNPLSFMLIEGLIRTYPTEDTIRYIKKRFGIRDEDIRQRQDNPDIILIQIHPLNSERYVNDLIRAVNLCGYYLGAPKTQTVMEYARGKYSTPLTIQFEPKYTQDIRETVLGDETELLHITTIEHADKIQRTGLSPSSKNSAFNYPERIYLLKGSTPEGAIISLSTALEKGLVRTYALVHVDLDKVPPDVRFFTDPNYDTFGIYTMDNIPPSAISEITYFRI